MKKTMQQGVQDMGDRGDEFAMPPEGQGVTGADSDEFAMPPERMEAAEAEGGKYAMPAVPRAVRLTFTYTGDDVRLVGRQPVEMVVPPADPVSQEAELGSWVEVRSGQEATLYRRMMPDLFRHDTEVFSPDPQKSVSRAPLDDVAGSFSVVVPELDEADHVALLSSALPSRAGAVGDQSAPGFTGAGEIARFAFRPEVGGR